MLFLKGFLLVLILGCVAAKCPSGTKRAKLVKGQTYFDVTFGITPNDPNEALKGGAGTEIKNGDVMNIDANHKIFSVNKICVETEDAKEVEFQFYGENLSLIDSKTFPVKTSTSKRCVKNVSGVKAIWIFCRNPDELGSFQIQLKNVFMKACVDK